MREVVLDFVLQDNRFYNAVLYEGFDLIFAAMEVVESQKRGSRGYGRAASSAGTRPSPDSFC